MYSPRNGSTSPAEMAAPSSSMLLPSASYSLIVIRRSRSRSSNRPSPRGSSSPASAHSRSLAGSMWTSSASSSSDIDVGIVQVLTSVRASARITATLAAAEKRTASNDHPAAHQQHHRPHRHDDHGRSTHHDGLPPCVRPANSANPLSCYPLPRLSAASLGRGDDRSHA